MFARGFAKGLAESRSDQGAAWWRHSLSIGALILLIVGCAKAQSLKDLDSQIANAGSDSGGSGTIAKGDDHGSGGSGGDATGGTSSMGGDGMSSSGGSATSGVGGTGGMDDGGDGGDPSAGGADNIDDGPGGTGEGGMDNAGGMSSSGGSEPQAGSGGTMPPGGSGGDDTSGGTGGTASGGTGGSDTGDDECPDNPDKTEPGECGCDTPDTDSDDDGTPDCDDECPDDDAKDAPGDCGCGEEEVAACGNLIDGLVHRYSFEGSGTSAADSVGSADGTLNNATQSGGEVALSGGDTDSYVELPGGIVSALTDATFEAWVTWDGGAAWQRVFDFGDSDGGTGAQGTGVSYVFLTPMSVDTSGVLRAALTLDGTSDEATVDGSAALATGGEHQLAVVIDDGASTMLLYVDGSLVSSVAISDSLSSVNDVNNWLGRSQFSADESFAGSIDEFRIYDTALSATDLAASFDFGPDPEFLDQ